MRRLAVDTSVLIDYINARSPYRAKTARLLEGAATGRLKLYVNTVTLSETLYVASRIYRAAGLGDPNGRALDFVEWVKGRARVVDIDEGIALRAGELKKELGIALPDCYVIATAEAVEATPLFRRPEREMEPVMERLRALGVKFLAEEDL